MGKSDPKIPGDLQYKDHADYNRGANEECFVIGHQHGRHHYVIGSSLCECVLNMSGWIKARKYAVQIYIIVDLKPSWYY